VPFTWRTDGRDKDAQGDFGKSDSGQLKIWARNGQDSMNVKEVSIVEFKS